MGAALLDLEHPEIVRYRTRPYILAPAESYELTGDVPNVVFPCAALIDDAGRMAIYYGAADTSTCLAFCHLDELIDFIKANSLQVNHDSR
jgi:beta-1,4-mannooligosaccharide/beta-1,4-mannosyl-N-acetylglucosamine phosphorylase